MTTTNYPLVSTDLPNELSSALTPSAPIHFIWNGRLCYPLRDLLELNGTTPYALAAIKSKNQAAWILYDAQEFQNFKTVSENQEVIYLKSNSHPLKPSFIPCKKSEALQPSRAKISHIFAKDLDQMYEKGLEIEEKGLCEINLEAALSLYAKASLWGHSLSKLRLAVLFFYRFSTKSNQEMSREMFTELASVYPEAMYFQGKCHLNGIGGEVCEKIAHECFLNAAKRGCEKAYFRVIKFYSANPEIKTSAEDRAMAIREAEKIDKAHTYYMKGLQFLSKITDPVHGKNKITLFKRQAYKDLKAGAEEGSKKAAAMLTHCLTHHILTPNK